MKQKFEELPEDIYILEAAGLGLISVSEGLTRVMSVNADIRCAFTVAQEQISYASKKTDISKVYPDPKQISVLRMLFVNELVREFRLLEPSLREEMKAQWARVHSRPGQNTESEADKLKYGKIWIKCSNIAFEAMDMTLVPKPGESSEHWEKMIAVAKALKDNE